VPPAANAFNSLPLTFDFWPIGRLRLLQSCTWSPNWAIADKLSEASSKVAIFFVNRTKIVEYGPKCTSTAGKSLGWVRTPS
jgi:hypothetical protein